MQVGSAWRSIFHLDCKMGAKFYLFAPNYEKWRSNFYIFTPNYEKLSSKVAKISKFPKRGKKGCVSKFYNKKKTKQKQVVKFDSRLKRVGVGGLYHGTSLPTSHMQCPHPREWLNACHIPPRVCLRCISCVEYLLAIYGITYVQPTNSISTVEKISVYFKLELVSFRILNIICICLCLLYRNLLSITSCRSLEFTFLLQLMICSPIILSWLISANE